MDSCVDWRGGEGGSREKMGGGGWSRERMGSEGVEGGVAGKRRVEGEGRSRVLVHELRYVYIIVEYLQHRWFSQTAATSIIMIG